MCCSSPGMVGGPLTIDLRSSISTNGVLSPSSGPSSIGWDSRTPLLVHNNSCLSNDVSSDRFALPTSPAPSVDSLGGATDTTELDNSALDSPEAATVLSM